SAIAISRKTWPGIDVHDDGIAIGPNDGISAEDLEPKRRGGSECCPAQIRGVEGVAQHALVAMIEPFEPVRLQWSKGISQAIEFDEIARHVLLGNDEWDSARGESVQCLLPPLLRSRVHDIAGLRRVEIIALDPYCARRPRCAGIAGNYLACRCRNMMAGKKLHHALAGGIGGWIRGIEDNRDRFFRRARAAKHHPPRRPG